MGKTNIVELLVRGLRPVVDGPVPIGVERLTVELEFDDVVRIITLYLNAKILKAEGVILSARIISSLDLYITVQLPLLNETIGVALQREAIVEAICHWFSTEGMDMSGQTEKIAASLTWDRTARHWWDTSEIWRAK